MLSQYDFFSRAWRFCTTSMASCKICRLGISLIPDCYLALLRTQIRTIYRRILVYIFCLISMGVSLSDEAYKIKFWILKEHNNFSYLWKFESDIPNGLSEKFSLKNPQTLQRMYELINVSPPSKFAVFNCYWLQRAETCTNCRKSPALLIFEPNWYIRLHRQWVNWYANEQKCKQWRHDESTYCS